MRRLLLLLALAAGFAAGAVGLKWDAAARTFDADLDRVELGRVLEALAAATRWDVRVEPGTERQVSARFERLPEGPALLQLFEGVSFLVLPQPDGQRRLLVYRTAAGNATERVRAAEEAEAAAARRPGSRELLVTLKPGASAAELAERHGAKVTGSLEGLDTYRLEFTDAEAAATAAELLADDESVEAVEFNQNFARPETPQLLTGVPALNFDLSAAPVGADGKVIVALVDSAIPANNRFTDWLLTGLQVAGAPGTLSGLGHGEAMLEALLQAYALAPADGRTLAVRILPVDVYGAYAETSTFNVAAGILAAVKQGADIINLSLGGPAPSALLERVLNVAVEAGALPIAAAGNLPTTEPTYPAAYGQALAVTARDRAGQVAAYANRGEFVDVMAPGTAIVQHDGRTYVVNGTSASTAHASGWAAALAATGRPAPEVRAALVEKLPFTPPAQP